MIILTEVGGIVGVCVGFALTVPALEALMHFLGWGLTHFADAS